MKRLYTYGLEPVLRNITLAELVCNRCRRKYTWVTADNFLATEIPSRSEG